MIKAVLLDVGNTLVKYDYGRPGEVFRRVLLSLGISRSLADIENAFLSAEKEAERINLPSSAGKIGCEDFWHQWDSLVLKYLQVGENEELARVIHSKWMDFVDCAVYPEVREVLLNLKRRGVKVGLISNGYEEEIHLVLDKAALEAAAFDVIVGVDTVGKVKPDPDIFQHALNKLNVKPEEAIFVGDNVEADYEGARNVGIHALLIKRTGTPQSDVETINNLNEVLHQVG